MDQPDAANQSIWIDLDNSPHVPLFAPIIRHFRSSGVNVTLTARDHAQTVELLKLHGFDGTFEVIGKHYGGSKLSKLRGLFARTSQLVKYIRSSTSRVAVAVSHGSRSMVLAARWLKIPVITMYDYEYTETRIFNRFSDLVLVPDRIPDEVLVDAGLDKKKLRKYSGIKEELYINEFRSTRDLRRELVRPAQIDPSELTLVVLRPPATTANYHASQSDDLLEMVLELLLTSVGVFTIVVPRTGAQAEAIRSKATEINSWAGCLILEKAVDGLELASAADLLISGGGTMNREAALLGVPVYSIFAGRQGALDQAMEDEGAITFIRDRNDLSKIRLVPRNRSKYGGANITDRVERFVIEQINSFLKSD